jgi:hypothetical protein
VYKVYVSNLPFEIDDEGLASAFKNELGESSVTG